MKKSIIFFLILILTFNIPLIYSATDEGYGEANDNLGQFTDSFEDANNVSIAVNIINNVTLECMELDYDSEVLHKIDYNDFTEYEENPDKITVHSAVLVSQVCERGGSGTKEAFLYYDLGAGSLENYIHEFDYYLDTYTSYGQGIAWMTSNYVEDWRKSATNSHDSLAIRTYLNNIYLYEMVAGNGLFNSAPYTINLDTWYYMRVTVSDVADSIILQVYSDLARTVLLTTLSIDLKKDYSLRYVFATSTDDSGSYPTATLTHKVANLSLPSGGYFSEGYFITSDYLNYTTGNSLTLLTNTSIPDGTTMTVQFSDDNSTWVLNDWDPIFGGFEAIDLRILNYTDLYLMYNFTGNPALTPRLYQSRLVTTNGTGGGVGAIVYVNRYPASTFIMIIFLFSIGLSIIWMVKKK